MTFYCRTNHFNPGIMHWIMSKSIDYWIYSWSGINYLAITVIAVVTFWLQSTSRFSLHWAYVALVLFGDPLIICWVKFDQQLHCPTFLGHWTPLPALQYSIIVKNILNICHCNSGIELELNWSIPVDFELTPALLQTDIILYSQKDLPKILYFL